jgi:hypothetical protein
MRLRKLINEKTGIMTSVDKQNKIAQDRLNYRIKNFGVKIKKRDLPETPDEIELDITHNGSTRITSNLW